MSDTSLDFEDFVPMVLQALEAAGVKYLIGGAVAVWAWGEPRTTQDLDLVVELPFESMAVLSKELKARDMLVPVDIMIDLTLEDRADLPINAIHMVSGYKAEFFLLKPGDEFRAASLARRRLVDLGPPLGEVYLHAPEDLILNKLRYFSISQQPKHIRDIAGILLNQRDQLDYSYVDAWAGRLGLTGVWREVQAQVETLNDSGTRKSP